MTWVWLSPDLHLMLQKICLQGKTVEATPAQHRHHHLAKHMVKVKHKRILHWQEKKNFVGVVTRSHTSMERESTSLWISEVHSELTHVSAPWSAAGSSGYSCRAKLVPLPFTEAGCAHSAPESCDLFCSTDTHSISRNSVKPWDS